MLLVVISVKLGIIPPDNKETASEIPSRDDGCPSAYNGTPSETEGRQKDAIALDNECRGGVYWTVGRSEKKRRVGRVGIDGNDGIDDSCRVLSVSVSKVGIISSTLMCLSRLEITREDQTFTSNSPSEKTVEKLSSITR